MDLDALFLCFDCCGQAATTAMYNMSTGITGYNDQSDTDWWVSDQEEELIRLLSSSRENVNGDILPSDIILTA